MTCIRLYEGALCFKPMHILQKRLSFRVRAPHRERIRKLYKCSILLSAELNFCVQVCVALPLHYAFFARVYTSQAHVSLSGVTRQSRVSIWVDSSTSEQSAHTVNLPFVQIDKDHAQAPSRLCTLSPQKAAVNTQDRRVRRPLT